MDARWWHGTRSRAWLCLLSALLVVLVLSPVPASGGEGPRRPSLNGDGYADLVIGHPGEPVLHEGQWAYSAGAASVLYGGSGGLSSTGGQTWHQGLTDENPPGQVDEFGKALTIGDFDGDGHNDLAVGIPGEDVDGKRHAGAVHVFYGSGEGLSTSGDQFWHQGTDGVAGSASEGNRFGEALAAGDFNGDGYDDLAVGIPGYSVATLTDLGMVLVLYGSDGGLSATGNYLWYQGVLRGLPDTPEVGDEFGKALAVGNFNCDGYADLAIGVPFEDLENGDTIENAGVVHLLYGSEVGLSNVGTQLWDQDALGLSQDRAEEGDSFGSSLAGGDFDGNGCSDLAVGVPYETVDGESEAGAVNVLYSAGLSQFWTQDSLISATGGSAADDWFGEALAAGDFNADGDDDLAVGAPGEDFGSTLSAGAVSIIYGSEYGLSTATGDQFFHQPLKAGSSQAENWDLFGKALAAGDFDGNGAADLAIGVPWEDHDETGVNNEGIVEILYGQPGQRLSTTGSQTWDEADVGTGGVPGELDNFGSSLAASPPRLGPGPVSEVYLPLVLTE